MDCLDALASDRQYRKALPLNEAMAKVVADSGKSFDPKVVAILDYLVFGMANSELLMPEPASIVKTNVNATLVGLLV